MFARACHDATGGNPLLLVELVKALRAEGVPPDAAHVAAVDAIAPRAASRAVLVRIGRLSARAAAVARATAVLGDAAALPLVAELAGAGRRAPRRRPRASWSAPRCSPTRRRWRSCTR